MLRRLVLVLLVAGVVAVLVTACRETQANQPPEVALRSDFAARLGHLVPVVASASDADGDALDYRWELLSTPDGAAPTLDTEGGHVVVLSTDTAGAYELRVVVDDGQATASDAVVITFDPDLELDPWAAMSASPYVVPEIASVYLPDPETGEPVLTEVAVLAGFVVQGGDLVLGRLEDFDGVAPSSFVRESATFPSSEIPYEFREDQYSEATKADVRSALAVLAAETGVLTFTDVTGQGFDGLRIRFTRTGMSALNGCWATAIPLIPEAQVVNLGAGCLTERTIKHEVLHALGFMHEHQRPDRDNYVEVTRVASVLDAYAQAMYVLNFAPTSDGLAGTSYDWHSIMHYNFGEAFGWFMSPKDGALPDDGYFDEVGWLTPLSADDVSAIRQIYGKQQDLIAHYTFDSCDGTDASGNEHHFDVSSAATCIQGPLGNAINFLGASGSLVPIPELPVGSESRSIAVWVRMDAGTTSTNDRAIAGWGRGPTGRGFVLRYGISESYTYGLWLYEEDLIAGDGGTPGSVTGQWHHLVGVYDAGSQTATLYVDGVVAAQLAIAIDTVLTRFGVATDESGQGVGTFPGVVDDLRVYSTALSQADVIELFEQGSPPAP